MVHPEKRSPPRTDQPGKRRPAPPLASLGNIDPSEKPGIAPTNAATEIGKGSEKLVRFVKRREL